jgi:hypothetical protein
MAVHQGDIERAAVEEGFHPLRELRDTFVLIGLTIWSAGTVLGVGFLAIRMFAAR